MIKILQKILPAILLSLFYAQWAMWGNPSLPVGNSDRGVGLGAGEIMLFGDTSRCCFCTCFFSNKCCKT